MTGIEQVHHEGIQLALIVRSTFSSPGITFFTSAEYSQQLAAMAYPAGTAIPAHVHNPVHRDVTMTLEALFIRRGRLRVDLYTAAREYVVSHILGPGDVVLLTAGGHGFEVLDDLEMIEIKQGPYSGDHDKTRFPGIPNSAVRVAAPQE